MSLLYITANPKKTSESYGLRLGEAFLAAYQKAHPEAYVERLDLFADTPPPLTGDKLDAWERKTTRPVTSPWVDQFLRFDQIVFVTPLWNMGLPSPVKAYIDQLILPDKTFRFGERGMEGLLGHVRVLHLQSRGGVYSHGKLQAFEHGDSYLRTIFGLTGVKQYDHVFVEGTSTYPDEAETRLKEAVKEAEELARTFHG
ncbi:FMN-dependent NADH-azoreductase [Alkalicoccus luteus]|uniref:FMN dependent NADH:quinone oxidoreductase n=1 Tax=Alkalicoccus luteus TaxID=1237094 RepID=A0A969PT36_9BACI|nr:NAD(P)H-dependent oxidoreductase [Alkalicoccus luteus]NJP37876.1 FMN-dependent NADH-azoreductase [Alkalicoccus luteus]